MRKGKPRLVESEHVGVILCDSKSVEPTLGMIQPQGVRWQPLGGRFHSTMAQPIPTERLQARIAVALSQRIFAREYSISPRAAANEFCRTQLVANFISGNVIKCSCATVNNRGSGHVPLAENYIKVWRELCPPTVHILI